MIVVVTVLVGMSH